MTRRHSAALMALGAWLLTIAIIAPLTPARAGVGAGYSFKDGFSSGQYNGNDGSDEFDGPWWETLDWGGSYKGAVSVIEDDDCPRISCARIGGETRLWGAGLARRANLQDAHNATMKFRYRLAVDQASDGYLNVAAFDGWKWTILDSIAVNDEDDDEVHSRSYNVAGYAAEAFTVGFFARGEWSGAVFIDDVEVFGKWQNTTTITEPSITSTTTTTVAPTTTSSAATTTSVTSTAPTTPAAPTTTTVPPTVTTRPPSVTTHPPSVTTIPPTSTLAPTSPPTTTRPPSTEAPLFKDERYKDKGALAFFVFDDEMTNGTAELATMPGEVALPMPGPVTQIMASITVTAVTIRSHLLSAITLGLLIAAAAVIGLGRRNEPA